MLDLSSLEKSLRALKKSLGVVKSDAVLHNDDLRETLQAGVIQNFEVAYEQCWKFMQRWLRANRTPEDADHPRTRKELFRLAASCELISDPIPWFEFGEARNMTSHIYDEDQAKMVFKTAERFLPHAVEQLERLGKKND